MATAQTLFNRALRLLGVVASGVAADANQTADCLTACNAMLESWRNDRLLVYATVESTLTMVSSDSSYTVGTGGDLNITRPVKFDDAFMRVSNSDTPVRLIDQSEWDAIPDKSVTSTLVSLAFYNPTMASSLGTLQVWPVPSAANVLHLIHWVVLTSFAAATDTVTLPPGYERAITTNLALEVAPEYGVEPANSLVKSARDSLTAIKRINSRPIPLVSELARLMPNQRGASRILTGP